MTLHIAFQPDIGIQPPQGVHKLVPNVCLLVGHRLSAIVGQQCRATEDGPDPYKSRFFPTSSTNQKHFKLGQFLEIDDRRPLSKFGDVT